MKINYITLVAVILLQTYLIADEKVKLPNSLFTLQGGLAFQNSLNVSDVKGNAQFSSYTTISPNFSLNYNHLVLPAKNIYLHLGIGYRSIARKHKTEYEIHRGSEIWNRNVDFYEETYPNGVASLNQTDLFWTGGDEDLFVTRLGIDKLFTLKSNPKLFVNTSLGLAAHWKFDRNVNLSSGWVIGDSQDLPLIEVDLKDTRSKLLYNNIFGKFGILKFGERKVYNLNLVLNMGLGHYAQGEYRVLNNCAESSGKLKMNMNYIGLEFGYGWQL